MDILAVIPCRLAATRLPRKPLLEIDGKPLIQHVYEGVQRSKLVTRLITATDSEEIADCVQGFGGEVMLTAKTHKTGTDRIAEVARKLPEFPIVINIQGDVLFADGELVDALIKPFLKNNEIQMTALKSRVTDPKDLFDPTIDKVVTDKNNFALYFSRSVIPHPYNRDNHDVIFYKNKGVYGFKRDFLLAYTEMAQTPAEKAESLEQLRALENGVKIYVTETSVKTIDINTPRDLERAVRANQSPQDLDWD